MNNLADILAIVASVVTILEIFKHIEFSARLKIRRIHKRHTSHPKQFTFDVKLKLK